MKRNLKYAILAVFLLASAFSGWGLFRLYKGNAFIWLPDYLFNSPEFKEGEGLVDIIFVVIDHWEPGGRMDILDTWMTDYRSLAHKHIDSDGVKLQHTWFYPLEQFRGYEIDSLAILCEEGYGEIGIHLHHRDDTSESLRTKLLDGIDSLKAHGALVSPDGETHFSFVHGNWALDNSRLEGGRNYCGVNDEITILQDAGCFSDFTFPAMGQPSQPSLVNKIFYATDDPAKPKSYDRGVLSSVGLQTSDDQLMIFEGPYVIDWTDWRFKTHPTFDDGNLYWEIPTTIHRFEVWLKANVHVKGRRNWVFVRPFTHGASLAKSGAFENILGENMDAMLTAAEKEYRDGTRYRLHYMTAREAFNVVKAAEAGLDGNPDDYRDFVVKPYVYSLKGQDRGEQ